MRDAPRHGRVYAFAGGCAATRGGMVGEGCFGDGEKDFFRKRAR